DLGNRLVERHRLAAFRPGGVVCADGLELLRRLEQPAIVLNVEYDSDAVAARVDDETFLERVHARHLEALACFPVARGRCFSHCFLGFFPPGPYPCFSRNSGTPPYSD